MAGDAGAAWEGVVERASSCWDCTRKKWKKNSFPGRRKEEIRTVKNVVLCLFFQNVLLV